MLGRLARRVNLAKFVKGDTLCGFAKRDPAPGVAPTRRRSSANGFDAATVAVQEVQNRETTFDYFQKRQASFFAVC